MALADQGNHESDICGAHFCRASAAAGSIWARRSTVSSSESPTMVMCPTLRFSETPFLPYQCAVAPTGCHRLHIRAFLIGCSLLEYEHHGNLFRCAQDSRIRFLVIHE